MPFAPSRAARVEAGRWSLALAQAERGIAGERLARTSGASLEFEDRRAYAPGDDLRHLDWRALARTDQLLVKVRRAEVLPRLELCCDLSRSMAVEPEKAALAVDLLQVLSDAAHEAGHALALVGLGERAEPIERARLGRGLDFDSRAPLPEALRGAAVLLRPGAVRILVSDCLCPDEARALVRPLASGAGAAALVMLLGRRDAHPVAGAALRMVDAEDGAHLDLELDALALRRYHERLARLTEGLRLECARAGVRFARVVSGATLSELCRTVLFPTGILAPLPGC